jgi:UDP-glucose 4-epimerase
LIGRALGRFGMPSLPRGALSHLEHPVVVDDAAFREATGFRHRFDEYETMHEFARGPA